MPESLPSLPCLSTVDTPVGPVRAGDLVRMREWAAMGGLLLLPLLAYAGAIFQPYEMRDGYSVLREAHEEPGKIIRFCASHARPLYGWLLEVSYRQISTVLDLQWIRLLATLLLGLTALATFRGLRLLGWSLGTSALVGAWVALTPSAQIIAGWSIGWPYAVAALASLMGFFAVENALLVGHTATARVVWLGGAGLCLVSSLLVYQPSTLFYAVPLAAAFIVRRQRPVPELLRWFAIHLLLLTASLATAYGIMSALYAQGVFVRSNRIRFEQDWLAKLAWFVREPLPNSLSLFAINDEAHRWRPAYVAGVAASTLVLAAGLAMEWVKHGWRQALVWVAGLAGFSLLAVAVSLVAAERYATYRTTWALGGVLLCFLVASGRTLTAGLGPRLRATVAALLIAAAALTAYQHSRHLLAEPQGNEWRLILAGARKIDADRDGTRVHVLIPSLADRSTGLFYHDEFGSLSSNSEWVPKEMFKRAMHDLHPHDEDIESAYVFSCGPALPPAGCQVLIDMRDLRRLRTP